jgi:lipopolysaccharide export system permease protein
MIFRRSLVREMTVQALALFLVLLGILFTNLMLRLLALAAGGTVAPEGLVALLGFNALFYFNILVSVTVFTTVLLTLVRWYRDSEMIVWLSSGVGLADCLRPILFFAAPFFLVIAGLSLFLSPWAMQRKLEYERQLESRDEIALITPGLFREFGRANLVVFVESVNTFDGSIKNVFLQSVEDGKDATTVARSGALQVAPNGDRFIVLDDGRRYEGKPGSADFRVIEFGTLGRRIEPAELRALPSSTKAIPTADADGPRRADGARGALLADLDSHRVDRADVPRRPLGLREPAHRHVVQHHWRGLPLHALQQLPQHRAELHRPGEARVPARARHSARDRNRPRARALRTSAVAVRAVHAVAAGKGDARRRMKTLVRYIGREVLTAILLIFTALVALFAFFDLIHELGSVGKGGYTITAALLFVGLQLPSRMYELFPVSTLIGTLFALAQLVASSEYTVMRVSGASLLQVTWALFRIGIPLSIVTFLAGEFVAPQAALLSQRVRAQSLGDTTRVVAQQFKSGFWFKQDQTYVNIRSVLADLSIVGVSIYEFDNDFRLRNMRTAESGTFTGNGHWRLKNGPRDGDRDDRHQGDRFRYLHVGYGAASVAADGVPGRAGEARAQHVVGEHAAARRQYAEDDALRDRVLEQGLLSSRRAGDDDRRAAFFLFPAAAGRRRLPHLLGDDARPHVLPHGPDLFEPRGTERLAGTLLGRVPARRVRRADGGDAVVARTAVGRRVVA